MLRRSILYSLGIALFSIVAIGLGGLTASMVMVEAIQGSGSAINVAGSLRRLSHRMGSMVLADTALGREDHADLTLAITHFENTLHHEALATAVQRLHGSPFVATYHEVRQLWRDQLKPMLELEARPGIDQHSAARHQTLLFAIDVFVERLNTMVAQLEHDTETRIRTLRAILGGTLFLTVLAVVVVLWLLRRQVLQPLADLLASTGRLAKGDFSARAQHLDDDELGQLGRTFNGMAEDLSKLYRDLEQRVAEKTLALSRSNRSLGVLYHSITRLHHAPLDPLAYQEILRELDTTLELAGSQVCLFGHTGEPATTLASTLPGCIQREAGACPCPGACAETAGHWEFRPSGNEDQLVLALRDADRQYGVLRIALPGGHRMEPWQAELLRGLAGHIGIALGIAHKTEQARLLALQEERSIIARELHDSIAQALTYMKIQASLLQPLLGDPARQADAEATLAELRAGISAAYRQLRELLVTFRLRMEGDFLERLAKTVREFADRSGLTIALDAHLGSCQLSPNQEIHTLQIVREALSNLFRHAQAKQAWVRVRHVGEGLIQVDIEDDGTGLATPGDPDVPHYGLAIMRERAAGLAGEIDIQPRADGGTHVRLRFQAARHDASLHHHSSEPA